MADQKQKLGADSLSRTRDEISYREERISEIVAYCIEEREKGRQINSQELLSRFPQFERELREFFENEKFFDGILSVLPSFGDDYDSVEEIDSGGEGIVYKAHQKSLSKIVAIKVPRQSVDLSHSERITKEAQKAARLRHPNIVTVHHVAEHMGQRFFVMEYLEGRSLAKLIESGPLPPATAARYLMTIAEAIHYAHQRQILHCDLKPGNIMLDEEGSLRITDFGLAKRLGEDGTYSLLSTVGGTASYMAPEQASRGELTTATDVYGLGAILYALLTGVPPFRVSTLKETLDQVRDELPKSPSQKNPAVDKDLDAICLKCLSKKKEDRYLSANALARDLERYLRGEETTARTLQRRERAFRWIRRHPAVAGVVAAAILISFLTAAMALSYAKASRDAQLAAARQSIGNDASYSASIALGQLRDWGSQLEVFAKDDALLQKLEDSDRDGLKSYAERICRPTYFVSCFILNKDGFMVGRAGVETASAVKDYEHKPFDWREYSQGTKAHLGFKGLNAVHISREYDSVIDGFQKISIGVPLLDRNGKFLGIITTSLVKQAEFGLLRIQDLRRIVALVAPKDDLNSPDKLVILVHPAYKHDIAAVEFSNKSPIVPRIKADHAHELDEPAPLPLPSLDDYVDPVGDVDPEYQGRWLAASAPVGNTGFFVIVQQRYEDALKVDSIVSWNLGIGIALTTCLAIAVMALLLGRSTR